MKKIVSISDSKTDINEIKQICQSIGVAYSNKSEFAEFYTEAVKSGVEVLILQNNNQNTLLEWVKAVNKLDISIPLIVISSGENSQLVKQFYSEKIFYYLDAPYSSNILKQVLESAINFHKKEKIKNNISINLLGE